MSGEPKSLDVMTIDFIRGGFYYFPHSWILIFPAERQSLLERTE